jgi:signal transduction histidine kinase/signal transduction protein with GAF and PtsI domain
MALRRRKAKKAPGARKSRRLTPLARATGQRDEALKFQAATGEILKVIRGSPGDTQPVFEMIVRNAVSLCNGFFASAFRYDGERLHLIATSIVDPAARKFLAGQYPRAPDKAQMSGRAILARKVVRMEDALADPLYDRRHAEIGSWRRMLGVPMMDQGEPIGVIVVSWADAGPIPKAQEELLKTFADQAVIAIGNVRLFNETKEALEKQTATAGILRVISSTPTDTTPVFEAIVRNATRLCEAAYANVFRYDGERLHWAASDGWPAELLAELKTAYPATPDRSRVAGRVILEGRAVRVEDTHGDSEYDKTLGRSLRYRRILGVPLLREGRPVGVITVGWAAAGPIERRHEDLLKTFADQAVIAIENVRLFNETKEALERQTATAEILRVIGSSVTDTQPVFDAIIKNCAALFANSRVGLWLIAEQQLVCHASTGYVAAPMPLDRESGIGACAMEGRTIHLPDLDAAAEHYPRIRQLGLKHGYHSGLYAPLLREGRAIGGISVLRRKAGAFHEKDVALLGTFASQAVIAIENVRLFNETKEALEQQTATAEVLKVISSSPTDVAPVFDAILRSAVSLCGAELAAVFPFDGTLVHLGATHNWPSAALEYFSKVYPSPPNPHLLSGRTILRRSIVQIADASADEHYDPDSVATGHWRRMLGAPMLLEGEPLGAFVVAWRDPGETPQRQVELLQTFADQAAIAIENVRLFNETKEALDQQKASAEVLGAISGSIADTKPVFAKILASCERLFEGELVGITLADGDTVRLAAYHGPRGEQLEKVYPLPLTRESGTGWAILNAQIAHFPDIEAEGVPPGVVAGCRTLKVRAIVFAPMLFEGKGIGAIWVARAQPGAFTDKQIAQLRTFADQAVIAIQNARLFREIQEKSAQLEVANKHKSDFLANMSHELRTPLNAIIGFSEVLSDRMFGEVNEKQAEYLKDIHESGRHLLSLINDILDLSKIEAGRMELELSSFDLPGAVSNAMTLVRERAQRHGIQLGLDMDPRLGELQADERKVKQILLNLLSNAVKFTPDGGKVDVCTRKTDGKIEIAVRDTGIGIAPEDYAAVFEEFKQVGRDYTRKAEGTGLGLALTKRLVELHGGEISLESEPGKGSTFTVKLPLR